MRLKDLSKKSEIFDSPINLLIGKNIYKVTINFSHEKTRNEQLKAVPLHHCIMYHLPFIEIIK